MTLGMVWPLPVSIWPLLFIASVALVFVLRWLRLSRRGAAMAGALMGLGFSHEPDGAVELSEIHLLSLGEDQEYRNVLRGAAAGLETLVFDFSYSTGSGKNRHTVTQTVAAFHRSGANMPDFQMMPRTFWRSLAAKFGKKEVRFEANPEFSRRYIVRGADNVSAAAMFTPGILSFFEGRSENRFTIEGCFDWIIVYRPRKLVPVSKLASFIEETSTLASGVLTQVPRPLTER